MSRGNRADSPGVVLITGASRGLGRATAERLARNGSRVFAIAREPPVERSATSAHNPSASHPDVFWLQADVRDEESVRRAVEKMLNVTAGRLNAVIANAGVVAVGTFEDTPADVLADVMETNYFGVLNTIRCALPALRTSRGRIVVVSSDSGVYGTPGLAGYSASKFALEGWAESVAYELRPAGIHVSIVRPGAFRTGIWQTRIHQSEGTRHELADSIAATWQAAAETAADPAHVAAKIEHVLKATRPRLRYTVGRDAQRAFALHRILPDSLFARFVVERHANRSNAR